MTQWSDGQKNIFILVLLIWDHTIDLSQYYNSENFQ